MKTTNLWKHQVEIEQGKLAYVRGLKDRAEGGASIYANPFPEGCIEFNHWIDGWVQAVIDERQILARRGHVLSIPPPH